MNALTNVLTFPEKAVKADLEDGYLRLSNTLVSAIARTHLSGNETQVLFAVISKTYGYRKKMDWVTGSQIVEMTGLKKERVSEAMARLVRRQILKKEGRNVGPNPVISEWGDDPKITENRNSKITEKRNPKLRKSVTAVTENRNGCYGKVETQKKDNSTKDISTKRAARTEQAREVINYLNQTAGRKFKGTDADLKIIAARLNEGFTVNELKTIIDVKTAEWKNDPRNAKYLRPQTLFNGSKADGYLNSAPQQDAKPCPHFKIIQLYHEILRPALPAVLVERWAGSEGAADLETRWNESEKHQNRAFWEAFFNGVKKNPKLVTGEIAKNIGLAWLVRRDNFDRLLSEFVSNGIWGADQ